MENASAVLIEGATIIEAFRTTVQKIPARPAMRRRTRVGWETLTWTDYGQAVAEVSAGLSDLGVGPGERVAILSRNRVEWHLADIGSLANGGVTVPLYPTSSAGQVRYILDHCGARLCFVEDDELLAKILECDTSCRSLTESWCSTTAEPSMTRSSWDSRSYVPSGSIGCNESRLSSRSERLVLPPSRRQPSSTRAARPGLPKQRC